MRTVKAITGFSAAEKFYKKLGGAIRYILPAATALAFMSLSTDANAQSAPTDIDLDDLTINENEIIGTAVGSFEAVDADLGETHTFALVAGPGDEDNASFEILANKLQSAEVFNYEVKNLYSVRIQATGNNDGLTYSKSFTITIGDVNDLPVISDIGKSVMKDSTLQIQASFFEDAFWDEDGHSIDKVEIVSLPSHGSLLLAGSPVLAGDILSKADCDDLEYIADEPVYGFTSFLWNAEDGTEFSNENKTFYIRITMPRVVGATDTLRSSSVLSSFTGLTFVGNRPTTNVDSVRSTSSGGSFGGGRPWGATTDTTRAFKTSDELLGQVNDKFELNVKAFPNPFASAAQIQFTLPEAAEVEVSVYNYMGALVKRELSGMQPAGVNTIPVGADLSNGSYIYSVRVMGNDGQPALYQTGSLIKIK